MSEPMEGHPASGGACRCPNCGAAYDASSVPFCNCVTPTPSPACPHCGRCLCKLPATEQQAFWASAPPVLFQRKVGQRRIERPSDAPAANLRRPLVLVAEDDALTLRVAQSTIERLGYGVITAQRGDEALEKAQDLLPDAVLTDALMPKMDGRKLCLALKQDPRTEAIKVVVMTSLFTKGQSKSEALRDFKADSFMRKPVDMEELQRVLEELIGGPPERPPAPR